MAVQKTILKYKNNIRVYITFHSYGKYRYCKYENKSSLKDISESKNTENE